MRRIVLCIIILIGVSSCNNSTDVVASSCKKPSSAVSQCITEAFLYFISHDERPDTSIFYKLSFLKGLQGFSKEDTLIDYCRMLSGGDENGYMGILYINGYKVLVFDEKKIGNDFYNADSLNVVDLKSLSLPTSENMFFCYTFVLDGGGELELLGCQPDDFVPIKINGRGERKLTPSPSKK